MQQDIKPRYEVHKEDGTYSRRVAKVDKKTGSIVWEDVETPRGYMVYFPSGASVHLSEEELVRQGYDKPAKLVDMDSGDLVGDVTPRSLKSVSEQKTARSRSGINVDG